MASSAVASRIGGISRPSALAIDEKLEPRRALNGQVVNSCNLQDLTGVSIALSPSGNPRWLFHLLLIRWRLYLTGRVLTL